MAGTEQSLLQFVSTKALPARVKVTEGYQDPQHMDWEFSTGDVIDLRRVVCPTLQLHYYDNESGENRHMSVSTTCPCLFKVLPYIPDQPMYLDRPLVVEGVQNLVNIWPALVCTEKKFSDPAGEFSLAKGEKIKLKRLVLKDGMQLLECKVLSKARLVHLPMDCCIWFRVLADSTAYSLQELGDLPCRVRQRLRLSDDAVNKALGVSGLPCGFEGDLFMEPPTRFVEVSPSDSPGTINAVPMNIDLTVAEREDTYGGASVRWYLFSQFLEDNARRLPLVVQLMEWEEEPVSIQAIKVMISDRVVLHHSETVRKMGCQISGVYYSVPITFDGRFRIKPRTYHGLEFVARDNVRKVRVDSVPETQNEGWGKVFVADVLTIGNTKIERKFDSGGRFIDETEVVTVWKNNLGTSTLLPLYLEGTFTELTSISPGRLMSLEAIPSTTLPVNVELVEHSPAFAPTRNPLQMNQTITLMFIYQDDCILASKDSARRGHSCPVPLSSQIYIRYISQYPPTNPAPDLSSLASCPDEIPEAAFDSLKTGFVYEMPEDPINDRPVRPPRGVSPRGRTSSSLPGYGKAAKVASKSKEARANILLPPIPDYEVVAATLPTGTVAPTKPRPVSPPLRRSISNPAGPTKKPAQTHVVKKPNTQHDDDTIDYEEVTSIVSYRIILEQIFGPNKLPPVITVPRDGNISWSSFGPSLVSFMDRLLLDDSSKNKDQAMKTSNLEMKKDWTGSSPPRPVLTRAISVATCDSRDAIGSGSSLEHLLRMTRDMSKSGPEESKVKERTSASPDILTPPEEENEQNWFVQALCHHVAMQEDQLSFNKGTVLAVVKQVDSDWLMCRYGDKEGLVHRVCVTSA